MKEHLEEEILNEYLDDALDVERRRAVEAHLSRCPSCRARLQSLQRLFADLDSLKIEEMGRDVTPLVLSRLPPRRLRLGWRLALAVQAGTAFGILIAALQMLMRIVVPSLRRLFAFPLPWERLSSVPTSSLLSLWKTISQPCLRLQDVQLPLPVISYRPQILPSLPITLCLLTIIPLLWWIGSIHLLPDNADGRK